MFIRLALALLVTIAGGTAAANPNQAIPQRVLFVGNSYLYYNDSLHNHVERMAIETPQHPWQLRIYLCHHRRRKASTSQHRLVARY
jgi:hypothetical protein